MKCWKHIEVFQRKSELPEIDGVEIMDKLSQSNSDKISEIIDINDKFEIITQKDI